MPPTTQTSPGYVGDVTAPPLRRRQPAWVVLLRVAVVLGIIAGWTQQLSTPLDRPLQDLYTGLERGTVVSVTIHRPDPALGASGDFAVEWDGPGRPGRSTYELRTERVGATERVVVDEGKTILAAVERSPAPVEVTQVRDHGLTTGTTWYAHGIAAFVALLLLVSGPQPRLATKWAWFWLWWLVPPAVLALVVLEPVPLWRRGTASAPVGRRLTGGWALLAALLAASVLESVTPYAELFG